MRKALVIGATTTGAAKGRQLLDRIGCPIVIVEEAAEVLEAHVLTSIPAACQHAILIGDHQQLRPNPAVYELARECKLDVSMFERLIKNDYPYRALEVQHRMAPIIADTLMRHFYPELRNAENVDKYPKVKGALHNLYFLNHQYQETAAGSFSHQNEFEGQLVVNLADYFVKQGYEPKNITLLCMYSAQVGYVKRLVESKLGSKSLHVETVDSYQGEENTILIVSLVRSDPSNNIGFLAVPNRVCVALSRAKHGLFIVGNMDFLAERSKLWYKIGMSLKDRGCINDSFPAYCEIHDRIQLIESIEDFSIKVPNGGCDMICGHSRSCGHQCLRKCHRDDPEHIQPCNAPCGKACNSIFQHPCGKECGEPCGVCTMYETREFSCGHTTGVVCHRYNGVVCDKLCQRILGCGHPCLKKCSAPCGCNQLVERALACGHMIKAPCEKDMSSIECNVLIEKQFVNCGHKAMVGCAKFDTEVCHATCSKSTSFGCGHACLSECSACLRNGCPTACLHPCDKKLSCGHICESLCGKPCSSECLQVCDNECAHMRCSETFSSTSGGLRKCKDRCVFCLEDCTIFGCTKKCWEPCRIQRDETPCNLKLRCGHNCLGLLYESCPEVCATCLPERLKEVVGQRRDDVRLIQFSKCRCILTVKDADRAMQSQISKHQDYLCCPKCSSKLTVVSCQRFAPMIKEQIIDFEKKKYELPAKKSYEALQEQFVQQLKKEIDSLRRTTVPAKFKEFLKKAVMVIEQFAAKLEGNTLNELASEAWATLVRDFARIAMITKKFGVMKPHSIIQKKFPQLYSFCEASFGKKGNVRNAVLNDFSGLLDFLQKNSARVLSVLVPLVSFNIRKIYVEIQIFVMIHDLTKLSDQKNDLTFDEVKEMRSLVDSVMRIFDGKMQQAALDAFLRKYMKIYAERDLSHMARDWASLGSSAT